MIVLFLYFICINTNPWGFGDDNIKEEEYDKNIDCRDKTKLEIIKGQWNILKFYLNSPKTKIKILEIHNDLIVDLHQSNKDRLSDCGFNIQFLFGTYYLIFDNDFFVIH